MKAADIPDRDFLAAITEVIRIRNEDQPLDAPWIWASRWDIAAVLTGHAEHVATAPQDYPDMPQKIVLAKAKRLIRRKLLDGCYCGCRGDFEPTERGRELLRAGQETCE